MILCKRKEIPNVRGDEWDLSFAKLCYITKPHEVFNSLVITDKKFFDVRPPLKDYNIV